MLEESLNLLTHRLPPYCEGYLINPSHPRERGRIVWMNPDLHRWYESFVFGLYKFCLSSPEHLVTPATPSATPTKPAGTQVGILRNGDAWECPSVVPSFLFRFICEICSSASDADLHVLKFLKLLSHLEDRDLHAHMIMSFVVGAFDQDDLAFYLYVWSRLAKMYQDKVQEKKPEGKSGVWDMHLLIPADFLDLLTLSDADCQYLAQIVFGEVASSQSKVAPPAFWREGVEGRRDVSVQSLLFLESALGEYRRMMKKKVARVTTVPVLIKQVETKVGKSVQIKVQQSLEEYVVGAQQKHRQKIEKDKEMGKENERGNGVVPSKRGSQRMQITAGSEGGKEHGSEREHFFAAGSSPNLTSPHAMAHHVHSVDRQLSELNEFVTSLQQEVRFLHDFMPSEIKKRVDEMQRDLSLQQARRLVALSHGTTSSTTSASSAATRRMDKQPHGGTPVLDVTAALVDEQVTMHEEDLRREVETTVKSVVATEMEAFGAKQQDMESHLHVIQADLVDWMAWFKHPTASGSDRWSVLERLLENGSLHTTFSQGQRRGSTLSKDEINKLSAAANCLESVQELDKRMGYVEEQLSRDEDLAMIGALANKFQEEKVARQEDRTAWMKRSSVLDRKIEGLMEKQDELQGTVKKLVEDNRKLKVELNTVKGAQRVAGKDKEKDKESGSSMDQREVLQALSERISVLEENERMRETTMESVIREGVQKEVAQIRGTIATLIDDMEGAFKERTDAMFVFSDEVKHMLSADDQRPPDAPSHKWEEKIVERVICLSRAEELRRQQKSAKHAQPPAIPPNAPSAPELWLEMKPHVVDECRRQLHASALGVLEERVEQIHGECHDLQGQMEGDIKSTHSNLEALISQVTLLFSDLDELRSNQVIAQKSMDAVGDRLRQIENNGEREKEKLEEEEDGKEIVRTSLLEPRLADCENALSLLRAEYEEMLTQNKETLTAAVSQGESHQATLQTQVDRLQQDHEELSHKAHARLEQLWDMAHDAQNRAEACDQLIAGTRKEWQDGMTGVKSELDDLLAWRETEFKRIARRCNQHEHQIKTLETKQEQVEKEFSESEKRLRSATEMRAQRTEGHMRQLTEDMQDKLRRVNEMAKAMETSSQASTLHSDESQEMHGQVLSLMTVLSRQVEEQDRLRAVLAGDLTSQQEQMKSLQQKWKSIFSSLDEIGTLLSYQQVCQLLEQLGPLADEKTLQSRVESVVTVAVRGSVDGLNKDLERHAADIAKVSGKMETVEWMLSKSKKGPGGPVTPSRSTSALDALKSPADLSAGPSTKSIRNDLILQNKQLTLIRSDLEEWKLKVQGLESSSDGSKPSSAAASAVIHAMETRVEGIEDIIRAEKAERSQLEQRLRGEFEKENRKIFAQLVQMKKSEESRLSKLEHAVRIQEK